MGRHRKYKTTEQDHSVSEITIGSAFYAPKLFDYYKEVQFHPAVGFALPVVRKPAPTIYTCLGGGYMASGAIGKDKEPEIWSTRWCQTISFRRCW